MFAHTSEAFFPDIASITNMNVTSLHPLLEEPPKDQSCKQILISRNLSVVAAEVRYTY